MADRPPFDMTRAAFYLIAFVIGIEAIVVLGGVGSCIAYAKLILSDPQIKCDPDNRLSALLRDALISAMALTGLKTLNRGPD